MRRKPYNKITYQGLTNKRRFGVELEINNTVSLALIRDVVEGSSDRRTRLAVWAQSRDNNYWHIKEDATCGLIGRECDRGWEVASYVGQGEDDVLHIGNVAHELFEAGCEVNENCGLHVHVEAADLSPTQIGIMMGHYAKFEHILLDIIPDHRHVNPYCETLYSNFDHEDRMKFWKPLDLWFHLKPRDYEPHNNPYRWRSVNLVNYAYGLVNKNWNRKTIEFRLPECSLVHYDVKNWIRLFVNFVDWAKHQKMPDNIEGTSLKTALGHMGLGHEGDNFYLLGHELFNTKTWLLRRYIRFNKNRAYGSVIVEEPKEILNEMWAPVRNFA